MQLYDTKDVQIVAQAIRSVAPESKQQRARLVLEAAMAAGLSTFDIEAAIQWWRHGNASHI